MKMVSVGPSSPNISAPIPRWNTSTISPNAPATERRFITTALIGTNTERNATASMMAVTTSTRPAISGKTRMRSSCSSRPAAANPPTLIVTESRPRTPLAAIVRMRRTTSKPSDGVAVPVRMTSIRAVRPSSDTYASTNSG